VSPEGNLNDPNGLCFWQGRWHLFYQGYPPEDTRQHWGHAVSDDLTHWRDLPYAIYPNPEEKCYSGATLVEKDRVIAMYNGTKVGNMVALASDPLLLNWKKVAGKAVIPMNETTARAPLKIFDPASGIRRVLLLAFGRHAADGPRRQTVPLESLFRSRDLQEWSTCTRSWRATASRSRRRRRVPYFWPIGGRHILHFFSHNSGGQYLLGDYDASADKFLATAHGKFNHGP
jgi:beta-fructofuranosidase